jgi:hypothetical protein
MRQAMSPMTEQADALQPRLQREQDTHKTPRLQMLDLLASGQAQTRQEVARRLGIPRHTMGRWRARYAAGGLDAWRDPDVPLGKPVSLAPDVLAGLEQARRRPEGCASYEALRQWVARPPGVQVKDKTLDAVVRTRCRAKLKGPRPSHTKQP